MADEVPTLYEWAGGAPALLRLTEVFYERVRADPVLAPVFAQMPHDHPRHVATWLGEVFGGPARYTEERGGYPHMLAKHLDRALTEQQRRRWLDLICDAADAAELPADPEFRSAFVAYLEWGTRLAVANSQPGAEPPRGGPGAALGLGRGAAVRPVGSRAGWRSGSSRARAPTRCPGSTARRSRCARRGGRRSSRAARSPASTWRTCRATAPGTCGSPTTSRTARTSPRSRSSASTPSSP